MGLSLFFFVVVASLLGFLFWLVLDLRKKGSGEGEKMAVMAEMLKNLRDQNQRMQELLDHKLSETHQVTREQLGHSARQIADVVAGLTKLEETNKQVVNFSAQLQNLQDILKNPKQRGVLGEYFLEETLKNVLPPNSYQMQYGFKNGEIVDAVVFVKDKIIPVDSKFSLENYERIVGCSEAEERAQLEKIFKQDLKNRIDETSKYIKPEEGTMDFAFMFIPSEAIYYDLLVNKVGSVQVNTKDLIEYAFKDKKVIIVSPTSFLAYLQTVLQGLRALQIEESAKQIRIDVEKLGRHIKSFDEIFMRKLHNSIGAMVNQYNSAYKEFEKVDKDVVRITGGERAIEAGFLDKPKTED